MKISNSSSPVHAGPNPGIVAIVYTLLFNAGLYPVISFTGGPHFPGPWESSATIAAFFQGHPNATLICAFLQFGAAIPFGIFTATMASRLQFLGVRAAGPSIAFFGGLMTAMNVALSALVLWVMAYPGNRARHCGIACIVLSRLCCWWRRLFRPNGYPDRRFVSSGRDYEAISKMASRVRSRPRGHRRIKRSQLGRASSAVSHSADAISRIYLAYCRGIRTTENNRLKNASDQ
jgi:hypothetical protein